ASFVGSIPTLASSSKPLVRQGVCKFWRLVVHQIVHQKTNPAESRRNPALTRRNPFWHGIALSHTGESYERKIPFGPARQPGRHVLLQGHHHRVTHQPPNQRPCRSRTSGLA